MTALADPGVLLDAWERVAHAPPAARGAYLVHAAGLVATLDETLDLDLARCAVLAAEVFRQDFGRVADAIATCPACGEVLEAELPIADLAADERALASPTTVEVGAWVVRALTTRDLLEAGAGDDGARQLLERVARHTGDGPPSTDALEAVDAAAEELAGVGAMVSVLECPDCHESLEVGLDVGLLLWERVAAAASSALADVAALASAFGWSEAEVLDLPPVRRRAYLALAVP